MSKMDTTFLLRIEKTLLTQIKNAAARVGLTTSQYIRDATSDRMTTEEEKKKNGKRRTAT